MTQPTPPQEVVIKVQQDEPSRWAKLWAFVRKYLLAPIPILIVLVVAVVLIALGAKNVQIGGLIGKLLGRKDSEEGGKQAIEVANSVPKDRVDKDGNLIPIGEPDSQGMTQAKVVPIEKPGLFDDPKKVKIVDPEAPEKKIEVRLPDGVKAKDVDNVILVKPEVTAVSVTSKSKVSAKEVDDLVNKYKDL